MRFVDQTLFGARNGNCFAACVATLLGLTLAEVPNFCAEYGERDWYFAFSRWLVDRDYAATLHRFDIESSATSHLAWAREFAPFVPWIAGGSSLRGPHACVYLGAELLHDPYPKSRTGLTRVEDATYLVRALTADQLRRIEL